MVFFFAVLLVPFKALELFQRLINNNFYNISVMRVSLAQTIDVICGKMDVLSESEVFVWCYNAVLHRRWKEICPIMHCISIDICAWYETTIVSRSVCEKVNRR